MGYIKASCGVKSYQTVLLSSWYQREVAASINSKQCHNENLYCSLPETLRCKLLLKFSHIIHRVREHFTTPTLVESCTSRIMLFSHSLMVKLLQKEQTGRQWSLILQ